MNSFPVINFILLSILKIFQGIMGYDQNITKNGTLSSKTVEDNISPLKVVGIILGACSLLIIFCIVLLIMFLYFITLKIINRLRNSRNIRHDVNTASNHSSDCEENNSTGKTTGTIPMDNLVPRSTHSPVEQNTNQIV